MSKHLVSWLVVAVLATILVVSCRRLADDGRLPPRDVLIRLCWQTFDVALKEKNDFIQNSALRSLGRLGTKAAVETIRSVDLGGRRSIVKTAVHTLATIPDTASYLALTGYTRSSDFQVRELAAMGLVRMHNLFEDSVTIRLLTRTMAELDSVPVDSLLYDSLEIAQQKEELRAKIAVGLLTLGVRAAGRYLEGTHRHPQFGFRAAIARTLGELNPPGAMALLMRFSNDPVDYVRAKTIEAMSKTGSPAAGDYLRAALGDPSESVQLTAAGELLKMDQALAVEKLMSLLSSPDDEVRSRAVLSLGDVKESSQRARVADRLRPLLDDPVDLIRVATIGALGKLADSASSSLLEAKLSDDSEDVREIAVGVLARLRGRAVFDRLVAYLSDDRYSMREVAVAGLGSIEDVDLQARILGLVYDRMRNDDEMTVRVRAAFTLLDILHERRYTKPKGA